MTRTDATGFREVLAAYGPDINEIALAARALIFEVLPEVYEVVWPIQRNIGYGTGPKKQTEHFAWLAPATAHVSFGFNYGAELPDPARLLEGNGKKFRHTKLHTLADVQHPALRALIRAAIKHRVPPPQPFASLRL
jgi:hypothetical protein